MLWPQLRASAARWGCRDCQPKLLFRQSAQPQNVSRLRHSAVVGQVPFSGHPTPQHRRAASNIAAASLIEDGQVPSVSSAYVHLPFCKRRCFYCDFPVSVIGSRADHGVPPGMQDYVDLLNLEIASTPAQSAQPLQTIFFGGGTPSLIPPQLLSSILSSLDEQYGISSQAEISMEADPGTFNQQRLKAYMQLGINRFSVGVQSFQEELLKACGRSHTLADVHQALTDIQRANAPNWSMDLISGLPHLTTDMWRESLEKAAGWGPDHISVYDLQVEDKTPFARWYEPGAAPLPSDDSAADMFRLASSSLCSAGYEHYEISSYARPGKRCQHNQAYWSGRSFYGFGLGATSCVSNARLARPRKMAAYRSWVLDVAEKGHALAAAEVEDEQLLDAVMLRLRMSDGLDLDWLANRFGSYAAEAVSSALRPHISTGHAHLNQLASTAISARGCAQHLGSIRLADPEGFLISNDIISDVFVALDSSTA